MLKLVVCEKPSVAQSISKVLGATKRGGNQRTTSNSSDFAPIWLLGAQIKSKKSR